MCIQGLLYVSIQYISGYQIQDYTGNIQIVITVLMSFQFLYYIEILTALFI